MSAVPIVAESGGPPSAASDAQPRWLGALRVLGALAWLGLVTFRLGDVPGMTMDEAWSIISARGEWPPANPLSGMSSYTGVFPVLVLQLLGTSSGLLVLRGTSVAAHAGLLVLIALLLRRQHASRTLAGWALPLIATCPAWVIMIRTGIEVTMFTAPLAVLGAYLLTRTERWAAALGGVTWGLLVYNHLLGLWALLALAGAWLVVYGRGRPIAWVPALAGFALGLSPRLLAMLAYDNAQITDTAKALSPSAALADLRWLPEAYWDALLGRTVYLRYVGRLAEEVRPYWGVGLVMLLPWVRRFRALPRPFLFTVVALLALCVLTTLGAPYLEVRYFVLPVIAFPVCLVLLGAGAIEIDARYRHLVRGAAAVMIAANLYYLFTNFYAPWQRRELGMVAYHVGERSPAIGSWHFLPKDELVHELERLDPPPEQIISWPSLNRPLRALMHDGRRRIVTPQEANRKLRSVFVDYRSRRYGPRYCLRVRGKKQLCFTQPTIVDQHFVLYRQSG